MRYDLMAVIGVAFVMWASFLGCGLALERVLGVRLANALLLPLGLCVSLVVIFPGYVAGAGDALAIALLASLSLAGLAFARGGLRVRLNPGWAGLAGAGVYVLYMLAVIAYGRWTWSGYDFVGDSAFEMLLANHIKGFGTLLGTIPESSEREFLYSYLVRSGYPLGAQSLLGTFSGLSATPVAVLYQGFIAGLAAIGAIALATLTAGLLSARRAALVGAVAMSANLTYQYALQGGIKEIALLATLCATAALARAAILLARPYAGAVLCAVGAAAALAVYNAVAAPFLGALALFVGAGVLLVHRGRPRWRWVWPALAGVALTAVLAIPSLSTLQTFFEVAHNGQGATGVGASQFGQLLRALPLSQLSGVWLAGEYRLAIAPEPAGELTALATGAILVLLIPGLGWALWRRESGPLLLLGAMGLVLLIVFPRVSPYAQGKLLAIASPAVVLVALTGLMSVRGRAALPALALAGALGVAIGASDLLAYGYDRVAPTARMEAMRQVGQRFAGQGLVMVNEFDEYAKVFGNQARISVPFEALTPGQVQLRTPADFYGHYFDLDQETLQFVERYPIIVTRRSPAASRPPANYRMVYQNTYYLGWRRTDHPQVLGHLPEQQLYSPSQTVTCTALRPLLAGAPAGTELMVASAPEEAWFNPTSDPSRSGGWSPDPTQPGAVLAATAGHAQGVVHVRGGRYAVWVQGDFPRPVQVFVDGHAVGWVSGSNTPGQWLQATTLDLSAGAHTLRLFKHAGRRHFGPGEWGIGVIGGAALQRQEPERLRTLPVSRWRTLCGTPADWVELIRP